ATAEAALRNMAGSEPLDVPDDVSPPRVKQAIEAVVRYHPEHVRAGTINRQEVEVAFLIGVPSLNLLLVAISLGSVFFGACTYIGNGPNFMVKSIADSHGAKTPSFTGYI